MHNRHAHTHTHTHRCTQSDQYNCIMVSLKCTRQMSTQSFYMVIYMLTNDVCPTHSLHITETSIKSHIHKHTHAHTHKQHSSGVIIVLHTVIHLVIVSFFSLVFVMVLLVKGLHNKYYFVLCTRIQTVNNQPAPTRSSLIQ